MREDLTWLLGEEWYTEKKIRLRDAKKAHHKGILVIQRWFNIPLKDQSFIFVTRVTRLIHNAGKYLLISIYPLPTHPTHNFTHKNGGNLDTLPGWPKKLDHNRPVWCAGQSNFGKTTQRATHNLLWCIKHESQNSVSGVYWPNYIQDGSVLGEETRCSRTPKIWSFVEHLAHQLR